jgi:hypothetical protein
MRSLKNLIGRKKPLIDRNTGIIDLSWDSANLTIGDFYPITNNISNNIITNGGIVFNNLPISPIGLTEGSVWRDGEGILRIV